MIRLLEASVAMSNIIPTILLVFVLVYWISVIIGVLDLDFLDFDLSVDSDAGVPQKIDIAHDGSGGITWLNSVLAFFNLGKVPLMIYLSFLAFPMWAFSVYTNDLIGNTSFILGLIILIPVLFVSLMIAKYAVSPFIVLFGKLDKETETEELLGRIVTAVTNVKPQGVGQAKIETAGAPIIINVCLNGTENLAKGKTAIVVDYNSQKNIYVIQAYEV